MASRKRKKRESKRPPARPKPPKVRPKARVEAAPTDGAPEIQTGYAPAGRETLAAIAEELGPAGLAGVRQESLPEIEVGQGVAGRETLAAISEEMLCTEEPAPRATLSYEDRPPGANDSPWATEAAPEEAHPTGSAPPPRRRLRTVGFSEPPPPPDDAGGAAAEGAPAAGQNKPGRATLEAIEQQMASWAESGKPPSSTSGRERETEFEVFEMATFVVRGDLARLSSTSARRAFVAERLLHRLPVASITDVDRVDVTPWTVRGTVVVRVWCRVPPA